MKMKYELKSMGIDEANAYFAKISSEDPTAVVDLQTSEVTTLGALAKAHPRHDIGKEDFLFLDHKDVKKVEKWWNKLKRIDNGDTVYVVLTAVDSVAANEFYDIAISSADHQIYKLSYDPKSGLVVPLLSPDESSLELDLYPEYGWDGAVRPEPTA